MKKAITFFCMVLSAAVLIPRKIPKADLSKVVATIAKEYSGRERSLDSFLLEYPRYFYDSGYATRERKYEELAYYFKRATSFLIYFQPDLYYRNLAGPFQFRHNDKSGFFNGIPDAWLFQGPIGNEPDSELTRSFSRGDSVSQINFIRQATSAYRKVLAQYSRSHYLENMSVPMLFDALRLEIFRISTTDLANSDFIIDEAALPSLRGSLDSWLDYTAELVGALPVGEAPLRNRWASLRSGIRDYLAANKTFGSFNRMYFLRNHLIAASRFLIALQAALNVPFIKNRAAIRHDAPDIYNKDAFNADYFAPDTGGNYSREKADLGELLFFDPILSGNNRRACASCHKPALAFTDGKTKSVSYSMRPLPRNSPTVINSGFQKKEFWDLRAGSLEDQLDSVVNNKEELHSSFGHIIEKLNASPEYLRLFIAAFPETRRTGITRNAIKNAIAVYERTLIGLDSRFDRYVQGDTSVMDEREIAGFNIFMGKARCGVCHIAPLFNGALPPFYDISDHHSLGVPVRDTMKKYAVDPDLGLMKMNGDSFARFSFKVPTLRNVALTAPYMHNGVYRSLEQVVDFYDRAAGTQFRRDYRPTMGPLPFFTILPVELHLTATEKKDLVAFLRSLTDTSGLAKIPRRLPALGSPFTGLNGRTIGGNY